MKLTPQEELTIKAYDDKASDWAAKHSNAHFWGKEMDKFHQLLPEGKILEIGSGGGRDAKELIELGYEYTGIDVSEGLIAVAKKLNPNGKFFLKSLYELDFPENEFDGFWSSATLLHIPKERIKEVLQNIHQVIRKDGIGFISLKQGTGEKIESDNRLFAYYEKDEFKKILLQNGFEVLDISLNPMSEKTVWLVYLVKVIK